MKSIALACACALVSLPAYADEYHYIGQPLGSTAAGMGGAFTGVASDTSAAYYNPAGLAFGRGLELSLSTSVYGISRDSIAGSSAPQPPTFIAFPSTFVLIKTPFWVDETEERPRHRYGVSILVPDFGKVARQQHEEGVSESIFKSTDTTTLFGASYAYRLTDELAFGVSAFYVSRALLRFEQSSRTVGEDFDLFRREVEGSHSGLQLYASAMFRLDDTFSAGLTLRSPSLSMSGALKLTEFSRMAGGALEEKTSNEGVFVSKLPFAAILGAGWRPHPSFMVSADLAFYAPTGAYDALQTPTFAESVDKTATINGALGVEVLPIENVTLRAGVYTDRSARNGEAGGDLAALDPDYWVFTGSAGYEATRATITFGGSYQTGKLSRADVELSHHEIRWWVAGSYRL